MKRNILRWICENLGEYMQATGIVLVMLFSTADTEYSPFFPLLILIAGSMGLVFAGIYVEKGLKRYWAHYCRRKRFRKIQGITHANTGRETQKDAA